MRDMQKDMHILVVDDEQTNRQMLIQGLVKHGFQKEKIFESESGEEAEILVHSKPGFFDVAVIDQKLKDGAIDGIETTARICSHERDIFSIIFTNVPSDNPDTIAHNRAQAYEAGAYRYICREGSTDDVIKVKDFVSEIRQLRQLKERVRKFYEAQQYSPSLLSQLDIMVELIDRGYKVWYLNAAAKKFQNITELPRSACSRAFVGSKKSPPCSGCIASQTFKDGKNHERIYLHPHQGKSRKLKWLYSWTQPMHDENGKPILLEDRKPIAVLESAQDLTDSYRLKTMPLKERLHHIACALNELPDGFDRIRIYKANPEGNRLDMEINIGYPIDLGSPRIEIVDFPLLQKSIEYFKRNNEGIFHKIPGNKDPVFPQELLECFIQWPLMKGERLIGLLSVSSVGNARPCTEDKLDIVKDYAEEALKAFDSEERKSEIPEIEKITSEIDSLIIKENTPESRLQVLVNEAHRLTRSDNVHIRFRQGNAARLLSIGKGDYYKTAPGSLPLNERNTPAVRVIISGREEVRGDARNDPEVIEFRRHLPPQAAQILAGVESYCFEPLIFQNRCIGCLALYKKEKNHFDEKSIAVARVIAERLALELHDYLVNIERMIKDYAFDSSLNAIVVTDLTGNINYVNKSFLELLGYGHEKEVLRKHFKEFCADGKTASEILKSITAKGNWGGELAGRKKDNSTVDVSLSASLVTDRSGKPIGAMASFIDLTERRQLEKLRDSIYRISETAFSVQNLPELYHKIYEIISSLIPAKNFYIALYHEENETISFPYFIDEKDQPPQSRKAGRGMTEYVIRTRTPTLAPREKIEELINQGEVVKVGTIAASWIGVPLATTTDKTIGVLAVQTYDEKGLRYTEKDKDMLVFVSKQIGMAIERKQAEEQIKESLKEKEVLLKEIHHRVKNNLAIIYELLDLQHGIFQDPKFHDAIDSSRNRIKSMSLIHETLYQSDNLAKIDSSVYIENLANHLTLAYGTGDKPIMLAIDVEHIPMSIDTAIPCGLIINELVTNAYKHAFPGDMKGEISIGLHQEDNNRITLTVADNGVGLPQDWNIANSSSIGLQLVDILTKQLDAAVTIEREKGARFIINFPAEEAREPGNTRSANDRI